MSKAQAEAGCAAYFRSREIAKEEASFASLLELAERLSPRVQVLASPLNRYGDADRLAVVLLVDSSGTGTLFGSAERYTERLLRELRAGGFPAGIGSAPNAEAALMLARSTGKAICADRDSVRGKLASLPVHCCPARCGHSRP